MTIRPSTPRFLFLILLAAAHEATPQSGTIITLTPATSPGVGEPGVTSLSVTGSNFPSGTIPPANVIVSLQPATGGSTVTTAASAVTTILGTTRRVSFVIPASINVPNPTVYRVSISGATSSNVGFASSNAASLTINPAASLTSVSPNTGQPGQSLTVAVTGSFSNFLQGATVPSFGAGITIKSTTVTNATHASVSIMISSNAALGPRSVTMTTGVEAAKLVNGFTVTTTSGPPTITDFNPKSGSVGALVTVSGNNLQPNAGTSAQITLAKQGGGTQTTLASNTALTSLSFVIPAGAATGVVGVMVNGGSSTTSAALAIVPSSGFTLTATPLSANLIQGQKVAYSVQLASTSGFNQLAQLSVTGLPPGLTASFSPMRITAGQTSVLTLTASVNQEIGTSNLSIIAAATADGLPITQSAKVSVSVVTPTTTLLGRTVVTDSLETPLAGVTVTTLGKDGNGNTTGCTGHIAVSDSAGNFTLTGLPKTCTGPQLIGFDGTTATTPAGKYAGVNLVFTLVSGQVTVSPVLVHLPRIDNAETFMVTQNSSSNQTFSWTSIPGLSVTVYAGTTFTMPDGTQPNPFPLAAVNVPVDRLPDVKPPVPTMIMVFIVAFQPANAFTNQPVAVYYPNTVYNPPGTSSVLMTLDPTHGVMVPYGTGTVSNDATQWVPDSDPAHPGHRYGLVHFDWHMVGTPVGNQRNPCGGCVPCPRCGGSVDLSSGLEVIQETDISYSGARGSISIVRTYRNGINPTATTFGPFGYGTNHNWGYEIGGAVFQTSPSVLFLIMPDGNQFAFSKQNDGTFVNSGIPLLGGGVMTFTGSGVILRWKNGTTWGFTNIFVPPAGRTMLDSVTDPNGNTFQITHNGFQVAAITDPTGRQLLFNYSGGYITRITAPDGTFVSYDYNGEGPSTSAGLSTKVFVDNSVVDLRQVTRTDGSVVQYSYVSHNLKSVTDANGATFDSITYDSNNRVIQETLGTGAVLNYSYQLQNPTAGPLSPVLSTTVTDALHNQTVYRFNANQAVIGVTDALGRTRTINRDAGNYVTGFAGNGSCGVCGDVSAGDQSFSYDDGTGNLLSHTDALGNTTKFTYDPVFNQLTSITDPLGKVTSFILDSHGNRMSQKDPNGNVTSYVYDQYGELVQMKDVLNQTTFFTYDVFGNISTIKDPLGKVTNLQHDLNGRLTRVQDPQERATSFTYDGMDRILSQKNAQGGTTSFKYDELGDLLTVTDSRGNQTIFTYDLMRELLTRRDPLGRLDSRTYDLNGNLKQFTDRRGQTSTFAYDSVNRLVAENYQDGSTVERYYDANDRLSDVNDSVSGIFSFDYDAAGRLTTSSTPFGSVTYKYDARGSMISRQVTGQPMLSYTYDSLGNLASASLPQASATFNYDQRNQIANITRQNGVSSNFTYDNDARLLSIIHTKGTTTIDAESYGYDAASNRTSHTTGIGQALITAPAVGSFDKADELISFGTIPYSYDANGNLVYDGTATYAWDSRNRLKSIVTVAGQTTNFIYDFAGSLIQQADNGPSLNLTKTFVLDALTNVAFESASDGTSYDVLAGQSIDSHIAIVSGGEAQYGLTDAINSTMAVVDQAGAVKSQFLYEPFGQTTTTSSYPFQFTGRMPVSSSLYYYRARFYNSQTGRFISEDPIGFAGGDVNLYRYVWNQVSSFVDPLGLLGWLSTAAEQGTGYANQLADQGNLGAAVAAESASLLVRASLFTPIGDVIDAWTDPCKSVGKKLVASGLGAFSLLGGYTDVLEAYYDIESPTALFYRPLRGLGFSRSTMGQVAWGSYWGVRWGNNVNDVSDLFLKGSELLNPSGGCGCH